MGDDSNSGGAGIGIGAIVAGIISWHLNQSIGWLILHAILGWIYVIYAGVRFYL